MSYKSEYTKLFNRYQKAYREAFTSSKFTISDFQATVSKSLFSRAKLDTVVKPVNPTKRDIERLQKKLETLKEAKAYASSIHSATQRAQRYQEQLPFKLAKEKAKREQKQIEKAFKNKDKIPNLKDIPTTAETISNNLISRLEEAKHFCDLAYNDFSYDYIPAIINSIDTVIDDIKQLNREQLLRVHKDYAFNQLDVYTYYSPSPRSVQENLGKIRRYVTQVVMIVNKAKVIQ